MGCGSAREKIEDEMMVYKLERMEIQMEKEKELKKLAEIEGHTIERHKIPDYIDPEFAKLRKLKEENKVDNSTKKRDKKPENENDSKRKKKKKN